MHSLTSAIGLSIEWIQPKALARAFELTDGTRTFATLNFEKQFGSLGRAETSDGVFTMKRVGFFNTHITLRREGSDTDLATYHPRWTGSTGELRFPDGRMYQFKSANFWGTQHQVTDAQGRVLLTLKSGVEDSHFSDIFKIQARLDLDTALRNNHDLAQLVVLVWYIMLLQHADSAAAGAAVSS